MFIVELSLLIMSLKYSLKAAENARKWIEWNGKRISLKSYYKALEIFLLYFFTSNRKKGPIESTYEIKSSPKSYRVKS